MSQIRQYLLSVIIAAVICSVVRALTHNKGAPAAILRLLSAIFLVITVVQPWTTGAFSNITEHITNYSYDADNIVNHGISKAKSATSVLIKDQTETYIENTAESYGVILQAEVSLSEGSPPKPVSVILAANASPYHRQKISQFIFTDLGIPEANQIWK